MNCPLAWDVEGAGWITLQGVEPLSVIMSQGVSSVTKISRAGSIP